jgi:hypothetical protein
VSALKESLMTAVRISFADRGAAALSDRAIDVIYVYPEGPGYHPVSYMAHLAAELFEAQLILVRSRTSTLFEQLTSVLSRKRGGARSLIICPSPAALGSIAQIPKWQKRYDRLVAWVFDSFWPNFTPRFIRLVPIFDHVFVTEQEDLDLWRRMIDAPVDWLPWGSDTLRLGSANATRSIDLLRIGRQPTTWEDDVATASAGAQLGLRFQGRPPSYDDPLKGERVLMGILAQAKFTLSFSNRVSPGGQTHPKREYITGRWTDALSAGATVVGIPPRSDSVKALLWKGALVDFGTVNLVEGLQAVSVLAAHWTPRNALRNYVESLQALDWRWRFREIAKALNVHAPRIDHELRLVLEQIKAHRDVTSRGADEEASI